MNGNYIAFSIEELRTVENGTVLNATDLGTMNGTSRSFTLTAQEVPKYIIIDSTDFWTEGDADVDYYTYQDGDFELSVATSRSDLPVDSKEN